MQVLSLLLQGNPYPVIVYRVNQQSPVHHDGWAVNGQKTLLHWSGVPYLIVVVSLVADLIIFLLIALNHILTIYMHLTCVLTTYQPACFTTYRTLLLHYYIINLKLDCQVVNSIEVHPHLNHNGLPMDGVLWAVCSLVFI